MDAMMNVTGLLTVSFLRVYFQGPTTHWGIQCIDFDQAVDRRETVSFDQTYPLPRLVCVSSHRRCYASDGTRAIVANTVTVNDLRIPLRYWPSVDNIPGNGRWPFCFGGGGARYGGANVTATCGRHSGCLDVCFADDDVAPPTVVWCHNSTVQARVQWDDGTRDPGWRPWKEGHPRDDSTDVIELDSPLVINRASGTSVIARHASQWIVRRNDGVCLAPVKWSDGTCHVLVHGICYQYDREASVRCVDLMPYPPGAVVALIWRPRLVRSSIQPLELETTDLFCLELSDHDSTRFLACLEKFFPFARRGMSSLSPFILDGRPSTVFIRVAPAQRQDRKQELDVTGWTSIAISVALGVVAWEVVAVAALCISSQVRFVERCIASVVDDLELTY